MDDPNTYSMKEFIKDKFDSMENHLVEIKTQTTKTNGRVSSLERTRAQVWGALAVVLLLGSTIITLAYILIDSKINKKGDENLQTLRDELSKDFDQTIIKNN